MQTLTEDDIAHYLGTHPEFFERHAELLSAVHLSSPHSHRTVSLQERQAEMLREKIRLLEHHIMEMIRHGNDNLAISDKLLRWARDLFLEQDPAKLPTLIAESIQSQFSVPQVAIRVWDVAAAYASGPCTQDVSEDVRIFASSLQTPFCGVNSGFEAARWLEEPTLASSVAMLPLRVSGASHQMPAVGLLVLASPDAQRFSSTMGTDFLSRIADLASAALSPLR